MADYYCTCGRPWMSILPPPLCPIHGYGTVVQVPADWRTRTIVTHPCRGRHCAHDALCRGPVTWNG